MAFELPALPYAKDALAPHISEETLDFHYGKHHNTYVVNLNKLVEGTENENKSLEDLIKASAGDASKAGVFNNAAQIWNHTFYWNCMKPNGGGKPSGKVLEMIEAAFGSYDKFREEFKTACVTQFGSGWGWLVLDGDKMAIMKTPNADLPMAHGKKALLTCDVWEHAYYIDFRNRRPDYVDTFLDHLVNWEWVESQL
ncbi:superoxide dismutase [Aestuariispira ectoiniformans]|uniref:superoxide dismutase n=1 Tax=Aestuariispira ectoiniformans TaxID=2775080 RepID=UPI00223BBA99|nr:superoxide dismutase [Aestuariispira ectoiniformans]